MEGWCSIADMGKRFFSASASRLWGPVTLAEPGIEQGPSSPSPVAVQTELS
jgi:hypothetical protein